MLGVWGNRNILVYFSFVVFWECFYGGYGVVRGCLGFFVLVFFVGFDERALAGCGGVGLR